LCVCAEEAVVSVVVCDCELSIEMSVCSCGVILLEPHFDIT